MLAKKSVRALCAGLLAAAAGNAAAIDVEFTYQGYLEDNGVAKEGPSDVPLVFLLHTSATLDQPVEFRCFWRPLEHF